MSRPSDLPNACARALARAARASGAGSRRQVRAAARRFVRRHRRDAAYLRAVLRGVAASSALALALLGLGPRGAAAQASFDPIAAPANPLEAFTTFQWPTFVDLDGDRDLDLIAAQGGAFRYFENVGLPARPDYVERTGVSNPLSGATPPAFSRLSFGDLDQDGDFDLIAGQQLGGFSYYENTGTATNASFVERTGAANPLDGETVGSSFSAPVLVDLDSDGDLDLVSGAYTTPYHHYFENTGGPTAPVFVRRTGAANPMDGLTGGGGYRSVPAFADLDADGDLDMITGYEFSYLFGYQVSENVGTTTSPAFVSWTGVSPNPVPDIRGRYLAPVFADVDGDGDEDLVSGQISGAPLFHQRAGSATAPPFFVERTGTELLIVNHRGRGPTFGDVDGDGDLDVVVMPSQGSFLSYLENVDSRTRPLYVERVGAADPFDAVVPGLPALGDLDGDGDPDLTTSIAYYENQDSATSPDFVRLLGTANPFDGMGVGSPTLGDLDADGDLDLIGGLGDGTFVYLENTGTAVAPLFVSRTGPLNPLDGQDVGLVAVPTLGDVDLDGDLDLVVGEYFASFRYFENVGNAISPSFVLRVGAADPLDGENVGTTYLATAALADFDGDGDLDLLATNEYGFYRVYENTLIRPARSVFEPFGSFDPLDAFDVGDGASPTLGDLDADGDLDLLVARSVGTYAYYENTGSATSPVLVERTGLANPLDGAAEGAVAHPVFGDLDGDGDLDLVTGLADGRFVYRENVAGATNPSFVERAGVTDPFDGQAVGSGIALPALGDLDGDGDLDLVAREATGAFHYLENIGSRTAPVFVARTGLENPLPVGAPEVGPPAKPALLDFDSDGDLDLVTAAEAGTVRFFENTGGAKNPAFVERTGVANPLDGLNVGPGAAASAGHVDRDGSPDLVFGALDGTFRTVYVPEPAPGLLLAAGLALLRGLERLRRGRRGA
ncbi:MAG: VCBS repeat-containing protein [Myxococcota bacterium]